MELKGKRERVTLHAPLAVPAPSGRGREGGSAGRRAGRREHRVLAVALRWRHQSTSRIWIVPATGIAPSAPTMPASSAPMSTEMVGPAGDTRLSP